MFNLPNCITIARLILVVILTLVLALDNEPVCPEQAEFSGYFVALSTAKCIALWAFVIGAFSDFLDGYLARKMNLVTNFGKLIDPLADKVLVCAVFVYLITQGLCPFWVAIIVIFREFLVTGLRQLAVEQGQVIAADWWGKWKMGIQLLFCAACLFHLAYGPNAPQPLRYLSVGEGGEWLRLISMWGCVILTVYSGLNYCWQARHLFKK